MRKGGQEKSASANIGRKRGCVRNPVTLTMKSSVKPCHGDSSFFHGLLILQRYFQIGGGWNYL